MNTLVIALHGFVALVDKTPADKDVKAGWGAFFVFLALAVAVAFLGWSLVRHLKKARLNADAGVFGSDEKS
jgi:predicted permease